MKIFTLLFFCALCIISCDDELPEPETVDFRPVTVIWRGEYQLDGCGFFVEVDSVRHKPVNEDFFTTEFQNPGDTIVEMKYLDLNREINSQCGFGGPFKIRGIEVLEIR